MTRMPPEEWGRLPAHVRRQAEWRLAVVNRWHGEGKGLTPGRRVRDLREYVRQIQAEQPRARISPTSLWRWIEIADTGDVAGLAHPVRWHENRRRSRQPRRVNGVDVAAAGLAELAAIVASIQRRLVDLASKGNQ